MDVQHAERDRNNMPTKTNGRKLALVTAGSMLLGGPVVATTKGNGKKSVSQIIHQAQLAAIRQNTPTKLKNHLNKFTKVEMSEGQRALLNKALGALGGEVKYRETTDGYELSHSDVQIVVHSGTPTGQSVVLHDWSKNKVTLIEANGVFEAIDGAK